MKNRLTVVVTDADGKVKRFSAVYAWVGANRTTWVNSKGIRSYVLMRHGFTVSILNK